MARHNTGVKYGSSGARTSLSPSKIESAAHTHTVCVQVCAYLCLYHFNLKVQIQYTLYLFLNQKHPLVLFKYIVFSFARWHDVTGPHQAWRLGGSSRHLGMHERMVVEVDAMITQVH